MPATSYHHGDLRNAALAAAREVVEQRGHDALVMRELASSLGVSIAALYRHFSDRNHLLLALADQAHAELQQRLQRCAGQADARQALREGAADFLAYAQQHVRLFRMMYDDEVVNAPNADAQLPALAHSYRTLIALFERALPGARIAEVRLRVVTFWSTLFGFASVCAEGGLRPYMVQGLGRRQIEQAVVDAALNAIPLASAASAASVMTATTATTATTPATAGGTARRA